MTESDIHFAVSIALSFVAGFACAVWLAVLLDRGAKKMKEQTTEETP
jgi:ABC-type proline/glycine betaine transport system permease subunit